MSILVVESLPLWIPPGVEGYYPFNVSLAASFRLDPDQVPSLAMRLQMFARSDTNTGPFLNGVSSMTMPMGGPGWQEGVPFSLNIVKLEGGGGGGASQVEGGQAQGGIVRGRRPIGGAGGAGDFGSSPGTPGGGYTT